jgi:hypothetical protein
MENPKKLVKPITAAEFDAKAEDGEDLSEHFDFANATKKINLDIPVWAVKAIDKEADRIGIARQALLKMWIVERLDILNGAEDRPIKRGFTGPQINPFGPVGFGVGPKNKTILRPGEVIYQGGVPFKVLGNVSRLEQPAVMISKKEKAKRDCGKLSKPKKK